MTQTRPYSNKDEQLLMADIWQPAIADDPLAFVRYIFPWGQKGTPLEHFQGPRKWQISELTNIANHIKEQKRRFPLFLAAVKKHGDKSKEALELAPRMYQSATASGRGPGKSALVAWLNLWMMSTRIGSTSITSANTEAQLKSRTWAELGKWHTLSANAHWFERSTLGLKPATWFEESLKKLKIDNSYYYAQGQLWSEENPDAFAGVHNQTGIMVIFDEASGIPKPIWTVTEGFFTEPIVDRYWFCFSNPRRNTGEFFECFHKNRAFWKLRNLDSRTVEGTDTNKLNEIIAKHGEDSDEARIEVLGQFPRQGDKQFISREIILGATQRELVKDEAAPLIMGIDVARYGDDKTVFRWRQGRDARSIPPIEYKGLDNMQVANFAAEWIEKTNPDAVCVDAGGSGSGVVDRLRERGFKVHEIWFGSKSEDAQWGNKRTELWDQMREWLNGGCIDARQELLDDLAGPEYDFQGGGDKIILEPKEAMKARGLASPDHGDALVLTFAVKVAWRDARSARNKRSGRVANDMDYDIFGG